MRQGSVVHAVSAVSLVNKIKFKMASLSLEEVLEEVCLNDQDSREEVEEEEEEELDQH